MSQPNSQLFHFQVPTAAEASKPVVVLAKADEVKQDFAAQVMRRLAESAAGKPQPSEAATMGAEKQKIHSEKAEKADDKPATEVAEETNNNSSAKGIAHRHSFLLDY